jgi:hypothetical protein
MSVTNQLQPKRHLRHHDAVGFAVSTLAAAIPDLAAFESNATQQGRTAE